MKSITFTYKDIELTVAENMNITTEDDILKLLDTKENIWSDLEMFMMENGYMATDGNIIPSEIDACDLVKEARLRR